MLVRGAGREEQVRKYLPYVRSLAERIHFTINFKTDLEDLVAYGVKGLLEALDRFEPERGVSFKTFSYYRIRGAIFDGLREMGWFKRGDLSSLRLRFQEKANAVLGASADAGAEKQLKSRSAAAGKLKSTIKDLAASYIVSLENLHHEPPGEACSQVKHLQQLKGKARLHDALACLPERELKMIEAYYFRDLSLKEAAEEIGVSKSWGSRIHANAMRRLRRHFNRLALITGDNPSDLAELNL